MKKFLTIITVLLVVAQSANAFSLGNEPNKIINKSNINKSAVSISFKEIKSHKKVYSINDKKPMSPASVQKVATIIPAIGLLGEDYKFSTKLYKTGNQEYHLVLGADPYLTANDLKTLVRNIKLPTNGAIKAFYIDDSIIDEEEWGEGWQWDDDLNPLMPKFGAYNIDKNLFEIIVNPTKKGQPAEIFTTVFYPTTFMNETITTADTNDIKLLRKNYISPDIITVTGEVSTKQKLLVPFNHPRRYFVFRMEEALRDNKLPYYGEFKRKKFNIKNAKLIGEINHPLTKAEVDILKSSNNMIAETVFKLAGGKYAKEQGSTQAAIEMFYNYCKDNNISTENIKITDGSGVSKNNLLTADFLTDFLIFAADKYSYENACKILPKAGEGTLKNRMLYLQERLHAKTGTLTNISALAGYMEAKSGKVYAFTIMINDAKSTSADKKLLEEYILRAIYNYK